MQSTRAYPQPPVPRPSEEEVREIVHESALRAGPLLRTFLSQPDRRVHTRHVLRAIAARMGEQVRTLRTPYGVGGPAPRIEDGDGTVLGDAQKAVMMLNALVALMDMHDELDRRRAEASRGATDSAKVRGDLQKSIAHGRQMEDALRREQARAADLEARAQREEMKVAELEAQLRALDERMRGDLIDRGEHLSQLRAMEREWRKRLDDAHGKDAGALRAELGLADEKRKLAEERSEVLRAENERLAAEVTRLREETSRLDTAKRSTDGAKELLRDRLSEAATLLAEARATAQHAESTLRERSLELEKVRALGDSYAEDIARRRYQPRIEELERDLERARVEVRETRERLMGTSAELAEERMRAATLQALVNDEHVPGHRKDEVGPATSGLLVQAHERKRRKSA